jgi:hypothetical protein
MEIEPSTHHKSAQRPFIDIEYSEKIFMEGSTNTHFAVPSKKIYPPGRSYLSPRVVIEGTGRPMTNL